MVRREFVRRKLQLISEELTHLLEFREVTFQELTQDPVKLAAVERYIERIVNRAIDVNQHLVAELATGKEERISRLTYRETFLKLSLFGVYSDDFAKTIASSAGLRNVIVHEYNDVSKEILYNSIGESLKRYRQYIAYVGAFVDELP